jgi:O-antigen/teichoic acid export membrane protein
MAALCWGLGLALLVPDHVGSALLGDVWPAAVVLLVPITLNVMFSSVSTSAAAGLRALGLSRRSLRAQLYAATAYAVGGLVGAAAAGALGSAWGLTIATSSSVLVWWWQLRAGVREHLTAMPDGPSTVADATRR